MKAVRKAVIVLGVESGKSVDVNRLRWGLVRAGQALAGPQSPAELGGAVQIAGAIRGHQLDLASPRWTTRRHAARW